jgi:hypothetical protein
VLTGLWRSVTTHTHTHIYIYIYKPEAANTVWSSGWWAVCLSKHVELSINFGIINSLTRLHLFGYSANGYKEFSAICVQNYLLPGVIVVQKYVQHFSNINIVKMRVKHPFKTMFSVRNHTFVTDGWTVVFSSDLVSFLFACSGFICDFAKNLFIHVQSINFQTCLTSMTYVPSRDTKLISPVD